MPRALQWLGCGMGAVSCDASYQRIAQPSIERGGLSTCHSAASSSASVTNRSCECPVCGPLTLHDVGPSSLCGQVIRVVARCLVTPPLLH
jgi:hypothetical protein